MSHREAAEKFFESLEGTSIGKSSIPSVTIAEGSTIIVVRFPSQPRDEPGVHKEFRYLLMHLGERRGWVIALSFPLDYEARRRNEVAAALRKAKSRHDFEERISDDESVDGVVLNVHGDLSEAPFDVEALGRAAALEILLKRFADLADNFFAARDMIYEELGAPPGFRRH